MPPPPRPPLTERPIFLLFALLPGFGLAVWLHLAMAQRGWVCILAAFAVTSFVLYVALGIDKRRAGTTKRRISERNLLLLGLLGGAAGGLVGMRRHRHKTRHLRFPLIYGLALVLQVALLLWISGLFA